jgi:transcriptional regulator GlxA family with amidase domain
MPADLFAFADLLTAANSRAGRPVFDPIWVAEELKPVKCAHGVILKPQETLRSDAIDAVLVPGLWATSYEQLEASAACLQPLIQSLSRASSRVVLWSYCTGVFLLARSGVIDNRGATATWWLADRLKEQFPTIDWQFQQICVVDPCHHGRIITASGANGHLPIAQIVIEERLSKVAYADIQRLMMLPRPEPVLPIFQALHLVKQPSALMRKLHLAVEQMSFGLATTERVAQELALTQRTLARRVKEGTGHTVAQHIRLIKLNQASEQLLLTSASIAQIGESLGFSDESAFRRVFKKTTGHTPTDFRQRFRS